MARKSKLKQMALAGDPWAIETLARMQAQGRAAGLRVVVIQRAGVSAPKNPAFAEAMRDARDIREWTDGPRAAPWRVYQLARALIDA